MLCYLRRMINIHEFRLGNFLLHKEAGRIRMKPCAFQHFELMARGEIKDLFPVVLKAELLEQCGFVENKDYPLLPAAREFVLVLPVSGSQKSEIRAYIKNNQECFGRAMLNGLPASNNFHQLHQLQNLYHALTGADLVVK
ncbi:MAG TPA: hypothetical protein VFR58_14815 [Flavisolibacter sp.]|nr:hypothetical protein [Flavisolibacter sp.]